ncbi:MAG: carbon-nitrogen hydrolase family protein, partial [Halopseudomonas aestusnigri]|nr:carbon-nitrogen hydrolase family protein [Halopseudomonas aestusnigri]
CWVLAANQTGEHPSGRQTFGHSCLIDPWGVVQASLPGGEGVVVGALDQTQLASVRARMPILSHRRFALAAQPLPVAKESEHE